MLHANLAPSHISLLFLVFMVNWQQTPIQKSKVKGKSISIKEI